MPRDPAPLTIRDLLSFRLHVVANLLSRGAALRYRREFGVTLWEWRVIAVLGAVLGGEAPLSLNQLAKATGLDKSQASRVVAGLIRRGLIVRDADDRDGRGVRLSLSKPGQRVYAGLMRAAAERNTAFLGRLTLDEQSCLERVLTKLGDEARQFIAAEKTLAARARRSP